MRSRAERRALAELEPTQYERHETLAALGCPTPRLLWLTLPPAARRLLDQAVIERRRTRVVRAELERCGLPVVDPRREP